MLEVLLTRRAAHGHAVQEEVVAAHLVLATGFAEDLLVAALDAVVTAPFVNQLLR